MAESLNAVTYAFGLQLEQKLNGYDALHLVSIKFPRHGVLITPEIESIDVDSEIEDFPLPRVLKDDKVDHYLKGSTDLWGEPAISNRSIPSYYSVWATLLVGDQLPSGSQMSPERKEYLYSILLPEAFMIKTELLYVYHEELQQNLGLLYFVSGPALVYPTGIKDKGRNGTVSIEIMIGNNAIRAYEQAVSRASSVEEIDISLDIFKWFVRPGQNDKPEGLDDVIKYFILRKGKET